MGSSSRIDSEGSTWRTAAAEAPSERQGKGHEPSQVGRFQIAALLGEGGMGRVFRAFDPHLKRQVALKMLRPDQHGGVERFVREARSQAAVHHPAVCSVHEVGVDGDAPYIVMQLIDGRPLDEAVADLPLEKKLVVFQQVAEAVHAAHRTGLIHRDIKPSNILVEAPADGPMRPYVLDFGLARTLDNRLTQEGTLLGTPAYMAPEQVLGQIDRLDRRTDVFALGATLYHLLAGQPPFPGSESAVVRAILEEEPAPLGALGIPPEAAAITFKCLEKDPARRYASARALAEDVGRFLNGEPVIARPIGRWYRLQKWARRNRFLVAVASVLLVLLATVLAWGIWTAWKSEERERRARFFTEKVEEAEALVRYSHMAPAHDVRPDRVLLRDLIATLEAEMERLGDLGRGAGSYALGRAHLALEELDTAYRYLSVAWRSGYRTPEVAATLAETLSALYREQLTALELTSDWDNRRRRLEQLDRT